MPVLRALVRLLPLFACLIAIPITAGAQTRISNTATMIYDGASGRVSVRSNTVDLELASARRPTTLSFRLLPTGYALAGMSCRTAPSVQFTPAPIAAADLARAPVAATLDAGAPMILVLDAPGSNRDAQARETAWITVESGRFQSVVPLMETGPDTGVFAGGVPAGGTLPEMAACDPTLDRTGQLALSFAGDDHSLGSTTRMLIDPTGYVFDSASGALIDGATVTLIDESGAPATVYGDDGVSAYPSRVVSGGGATDASGRSYRFAQGRYRFPLARPGRYRLKIEPPAGYSAPSARPRAALAALRDPRGQAFLLNDASFGGIFALSEPAPFVSDIPLDRQGAPVLLLTKTASTRDASPGDFIHYVVRLENRSAVAVTGVHLTDLLPRGLRYERGSTRGAAEPAVGADGRTLDLPVASIAAKASLEVRYAVSVIAGAPAGEAVNRVLASGANGVTSNEASASVRVRALLFTDALTLVGRVTAGACGERRPVGVPGVRLMLEDGTFTVTDRDGLYHFEGVRAGRHVVQLDRTSLPPTLTPIRCGDDPALAGSATSRFVERTGGLMARADFRLRDTGRGLAAPAGPTLATMSAAQAAGDHDWFAGQRPGVALLFPGPDHNPRAAVLRVVVKHGPRQRVALTINGMAVDPLALQSSEVRGGVAISIWTGVPLREGDNALEARVIDADGRVAATLRRIVHVAGAPAAATLMTAASRLTADGVTRPVIAVRLTDRGGSPVRDGVTAPVTVDAPYAPFVEPGGALTPPAAAVARVVGDDGIAYVTLQPTRQAGAVRIAMTLRDGAAARQAELRPWLTGAATEWTVVGFGAGSIGFDTLRRHLSGGAERERGVVTNGQLALYAKGRIRGSWLLTLAYDSERRFDPDRGLLGTIDPDRYYTVYGDGTLQGHDAPTAGKLYLRLERRDAFALFGDFETGLSRTQLTRYSRTLSGVQAAYDGAVASVTAFAARGVERYGRDEIRGGGITGPYRLSAREIVPNSDKLRLEVRDRLRPELVVKATPLVRHIDYDIDPVAGTVRFREPVLGRDPAGDPVFIVADYETVGPSAAVTAGGRAGLRLAGGAVEAGLSLLRDETAGVETVAGLDLRARPAAGTEVRAEAATGGRGGLRRGQAWLIEVEHHDAAIDLLAYARQQDVGFGLGQQSVFERDARRVGVDGRVRLDDRLSLAASAWRQDQLSGDASHSALDARVEYRRDAGTLFAGVQLAGDAGDGEDSWSRLLTVGGTRSALGGALMLTGQVQVAPGGGGSEAAPARQQLLANYRAAAGVRVIGGYEVAIGDDRTTRAAQMGLEVAPWTGGKLTGAVHRQLPGENAARTFAQYGLAQSLALGPRWSVDATLDAVTTLRGGTHARPSTPGGALLGQEEEDYGALTLGAAYRAARWSWNGRVEVRRAATADRFALSTSVLRTLDAGKTVAASLRYSAADERGAMARSFSLDVGLAWRPLDSGWSVLDRATLRGGRADAGVSSVNLLGLDGGGGARQDVFRAINNLAIDYRSAPQDSGGGVEASLYHGAKWVSDRFGGDMLTGFIQVLGLDLRRDLSRHVDIGVQGSVQHAWERRTAAFSAGAFVGVSPAANLWLTIGYNVAGYRDADFEEERRTRRGPYLTMRLKFDRDSVAGLLGRGR